jgi:putative Holliday junction resolvase
MRILGVDPGEKRIGLAVSDPTETIASPLAVIAHVSREVDAAAIAQTAASQEARLIVVGQALDADNQPTLQSRRAEHLAEAIRRQCDIPVELWDESGSTQAAQAAQAAMGVSRARRRGKRRGKDHGHLDDLAATYILQTYLDAQQET